MRNNKTIESLEKTLANSYSLAMKLQNYHWNVEGASFKALHELFELQYNEIFLSVDETAERIRAMGAKVEGTFENFYKNSDLKPANKNLDAKSMVLDIVKDYETLIEGLKAFVKNAQEENDEATADIFITKIQAYEKSAWMLRSSL